MLRSLLIGMTTGARALTPLAAVARASARGELDSGNPVAALLGHPMAGAGAGVLAAGELWGDKWKSAPDRIVPAGLIARVVSGGLTGAALAPRRRALLGGVLGATAAVGAAYITWTLRMRALRRYGQTSTGLVEDAITIGAAQAVISGAGARAVP